MLKQYGPNEMRLIGAFKLAATNDTGRLEIPCGSKSGAIALRARAYAFAKAMRNDLEKHPELTQAVEWANAIAMSITEDGLLILRRKDQEAGMLALDKILADSGTGLVDPAKDAMEETLKRAIAAAGGAGAGEPEAAPGPVAAPNPYYKR